MARVASAQHDLFSPTQRELFGGAGGEVSVGVSDPLGELRALLALVQVADQLPWTDAWAAMEQEHRAIGLAREAGPEGQALLDAVFTETERLLAMTDR